MSRIFFYFLQSSTKRSSELRYKIFILIWKRRVNKIPFFVCSPCVCVCVYMYNTMLRYRNSCVQDERIFRIRLKIWRKFCSRKYSIKLILFILRRTINRKIERRFIMRRSWKTTIVKINRWNGEMCRLHGEGIFHTHSLKTFDLDIRAPYGAEECNLQ